MTLKMSTSDQYQYLPISNISIKSTDDLMTLKKTLFLVSFYILIREALGMMIRKVFGKVIEVKYKH